MNNQEQFIVANETSALREQLAAAQERDWTGSLIDRLNEFARENSGEYSEVHNGTEASAMIQRIHGDYNHIRIQLTAEKARAELSAARETCQTCKRDWNPSLIESGECVFCILQAQKQRADKAEAALKEEKQWSEDLAKQCCEMEDALGFKQDQHDASGAFVPTMGPWKERVRDLLAKEGELGDAKDSFRIIVNERDAAMANYGMLREALIKAEYAFDNCAGFIWNENARRNNGLRWNFATIHASVKDAISSSCGKGWLSPDKAQLAREALELVAECFPAHSMVKKALAALKEDAC